MMANADVLQEREPAEALLLELRTDIKQGFESLSVKLVGEIKDLLSSYKSMPLSRSVSASDTAESRLPTKNSNGESKNSNGESEILPSALSGVIKVNGEKCETDDGSQSDKLPSAGSESQPLNNLIVRRHSTSSNIAEWKDALARQVTAQEHGPDMPLGIGHLIEEIRERHARETANQEQCVYRLVHAKAFIVWSVFVILGNAVWMGWEVTVAMDSLSAHGGEDNWHKEVNMGFALWFMLDLLLKLIAFKADFFLGPEQQWNMLDFVLVLLSIPDFFSSLLNVSFVRTLRLFRLTRGFRLMRLVKFLKSLREILMTVFYTMGSLFWSFIAILLVAYIVALLFMQSIYSALQSSDHSTDDETTADFMTVGETMLVLFSTIAGGQDWWDLVRHFKDIGAYGAVYGLFAWVYFMLFGLVNVVVAVFCAKATEAAHVGDLSLQKAKEHYQHQIHDLVRIFHLVDIWGHGVITKVQFHQFARALENQLMLRPHGLQLFALDELWGKMAIYAEREDGKVDVTAFVMGFMRFSEESVSSDLLLLEAKIKRMREETKEQCEELHEHIRDCCQEITETIEQKPQGRNRLNPEKRSWKSRSREIQKAVLSKTQSAISI